MPTRDDQDWERRRQQIINGALHVFSRKGFEKATNKDIADAAGVKSPGLIYHYFKDKGDLFRQVLEHHAPAVQLLSHPEAMMDLPLHEVLTRLAQAYLKTIDSPTTVAIIKLIMGESLRRPGVAEMINSIGPGRAFTFLTRYFEKQMDAGVLRRMDPGAAARCFIGPLLAYVIAREVFPQPDAHTLEAETMVQTAVNVFLAGALVAPPDHDS